MTEPATFLSCLTPPGSGAIAVLGLFGPSAWIRVCELFRPASNRPLPESPGEVGSVWFGRLGDGGAADEVVLTLVDLHPAPYLELHCHGGRQVVAWLTEILQGRGVVPVPWAEFQKFVVPRTEAEALRCLAEARTVRTAAILLDQCHGAYETAVAEVERRVHANEGESARRLIDELLSRAGLGRHLVEPWRVVVAGPPNVGKSSLVNALAGYQRSVVAPVAGTTRDVVSVSLAVDGWPVELLDTAGLRDSAGGLEQAGVERAQAALRDADLVLWLIDATEESPEMPEGRSDTMLIVANKCDLPQTRPRAADLRISALTGEGIDRLLAAIARRIVPDAPPPGSAVPFLSAQVEYLDRLRWILARPAPEGAR